MSVPAGDAEKGAKLFKGRCAQCHTYNEGGPNKQGPNLWGIIGRTAGTVEGYTYSKANKESGVDWAEPVSVPQLTHDRLFEYLVNPKKFMKGTKMAFPGFKKPQDRADVIAFLRENAQ